MKSERKERVESSKAMKVSELVVAMVIADRVDLPLRTNRVLYTCI